MTTVIDDLSDLELKAAMHYLKHERDKKQMMASTVATHLGLALFDYFDLESGAKTPTIEQLKGISQLLSVNWDKMISSIKKVEGRSVAEIKAGIQNV